MIKVNKITIKNYKNIQVKNLELSSFNLIVGPNNSGKSNFMQIFSFINYIINGSSDEIERCFKTGHFGIFGFIVPEYLARERSKEKRISFAIEFENTNSEMIYAYFLELEWNYVIKEKKTTLNLLIAEESFDFKNKHTPGPSKNILKRDETTVNFGDQIPSSIVKSAPSYISGISLLKIFSNDENIDHPYNMALRIFDTLLKSETYYFSHSDFIINEPTKRLTKVEGKTVSYDLIEEIFKLKANENHWKIFKESLMQILKIDNVETLSLPYPKSGKNDVHSSEDKIYYVFFHHFNTFKKISELSDGSRLLIALLVKILSIQNELILIEEPENSLHPKALKDLILFFRSFENEKQFIINTHSITLINMIAPENVTVATCNDEGSSTFSKVSNVNELKKRLKKGHIVFSDALFFENKQDDEENLIL